MADERDRFLVGDPLQGMAPAVQVQHPPEHEYGRRWDAVRKALEDRELDALLVCGPENIYYLTGLQHQGYFALTLLVIPASGDPLLVTRSMERRTVADHRLDVVHLWFDDDEPPVRGVTRALDAAGLSTERVGVEKHTMFFPIAVWDQLRAARPGVRWCDGSGVVDELRAVKSPWELERIRTAAAISDRAVRAGIAAAGVGINEREVAAAIYHALALGGSEYPGFAPLVRSTEHFGHEHETWHDRTLTSGDGLLIELSASVDRYHAPLTRLVHVGRAPDGLDRAAEIALAGLRATVEALRPGMAAGEVYTAWQSTIDDHLGHQRYERHHCGYSVGIGFPPSWVGGSSVVGLRRDSPTLIREGMVFHLLSWLMGEEPTDYAVSDTAVITAQGCELITSTHQGPIIIS